MRYELNYYQIIHAILYLAFVGIFNSAMNGIIATRVTDPITADAMRIFWLLDSLIVLTIGWFLYLIRNHLICDKKYGLTGFFCSLIYSIWGLLYNKGNEMIISIYHEADAVLHGGANDTNEWLEIIFNILSLWQLYFYFIFCVRQMYTLRNDQNAQLENENGHPNTEIFVIFPWMAHTVAAHAVYATDSSADFGASDVDFGKCRVVDVNELESDDHSLPQAEMTNSWNDTDIYGI